MNTTATTDGRRGEKAGPSHARLAIVLSHPTQYYSPWFRWMATQGGVDLRVFYLWKFGVTPQRDPRFQTTFAWDVDLLSGYAHEFVANVAREPGTERFGGLNNPELPARLEAWQPDAILLFGYKYATHLRVLRWAKARRIPLIFRGDSHALGAPRGGLLRRWLLRWVYRHFSAVTYVGIANRDYFAGLGVPAPKLFFAPHAVDQERFNPDRTDVRQPARALRASLGIGPGQKLILFSGKFVAWKQPVPLLEAFLAELPANAVLVLAGDGPEKETLRSIAASAPAGRVHFLPFANQQEMPARYASADVFVLPSSGTHETWGLAVNEAMHMGVPCVVSDRVGCQQNLVLDGETGWVFRHDSAPDLRSTLARAVSAVSQDPDGWRRRARDHAAGYSYAAATEGLRRAIASVTGDSRP